MWVDGGYTDQDFAHDAPHLFSLVTIHNLDDFQPQMNRIRV